MIAAVSLLLIAFSLGVLAGIAIERTRWWW
jgi:hypothetical protein